jgi:uncharacterized protein YjbJ (UPF0337 family)
MSPRRLSATPNEGAAMNWDQIEGQWKQLQSEAKSKWAKLTDDDVKNAGAKKDHLIGKIQERYGILKEEAEKQVDQWIKDIKPIHDGTTKPNAR